MREGSQGQAKRSPWNRAQNESRVLIGCQTNRWVYRAAGLAALQSARVFRRAFQGLRFACPWLSSCIPDGMRRMSPQIFGFLKPSKPPYNLSLRLPPQLTDKGANRCGVFRLRLGLQIELEFLGSSVSLAPILKDSCQFEVRL